MTTTGISSATAGVVSTHSSIVPSATASTPAVVTTQKNSAQTVSISPRIIDDPTAGIITQYLDSSGKVASQYPSSRVVAYLRAGLTEQGLSRHVDTHATTQGTETVA